MRLFFEVIEPPLLKLNRGFRNAPSRQLVWLADGWWEHHSLQWTFGVPGSRGPGWLHGDTHTGNSNRQSWELFPPMALGGLGRGEALHVRTWPCSVADFRKRFISSLFWKQVGDRCPLKYIAKWCAAPSHMLIASFLCQKQAQKTVV